MTDTVQLWTLLAALVLLGLLAASVALFAPRPLAAGSAVIVARVIDGDTVDVRHQDGGTERVRLLGIDTPESVHPDRLVERGAREATAYARRVLAGQRVTLTLDPSQDRTDRYGRTLGYLMLPDGRNYSVEAARAGVARAYVFRHRPPAAHLAIRSAENEARRARRGLWSSC